MKFSNYDDDNTCYYYYGKKLHIELTISVLK